MVHAPNPDNPDVAVIKTLNAASVDANERAPEAKRVSALSITVPCAGATASILKKTCGEHGKRFIHVHHIWPLRTLDEGCQIDPVMELVLLCPNCHAMVHWDNGAVTSRGEIDDILLSQTDFLMLEKLLVQLKTQEQVVGTTWRRHLDA